MVKTGVEYIFEDYLKGTDGIKQIDMAVDGTVTEEYVTEEAVAGSDVVLTIDANLQKVAEDALKNKYRKNCKWWILENKYDAKAGACSSNECKNWRSSCNGKLSRL